MFKYYMGSELNLYNKKDDKKYVLKKTCDSKLSNKDKRILRLETKIQILNDELKKIKSKNKNN